jgi:putative flippase GtrA
MLQKINISKDSWFAQLVRFTGVGAIGTGVHFAIFGLLALIMLPAIASGIGATFGAITNYILNYKFTFDSKKSHKETLPKYMIISGVGIVLNMLIVYLINTELGFHAYLAQIVATGFVLIFNFAGSKLWAFK